MTLAVAAVRGVVAALVIDWAAGADACTSTSGCLSTCQQAHGGCNCEALLCNETLSLCQCPAGGAALRQDRGCTLPASSGEAQGGCAPTHEVLWNAAAWGSHELQPSDIEAGIMSPPLENVLWRSLAAALELGTLEVSVSDVRITSIVVPSGNPEGLLHFDWAFRFCSDGRVLTPESDPRSFEHRFSAEAHHYAMFHLSTMRILSLTPLGTDSTVSPSTSLREEGSAGARGEEGTSLLESIWWVPWLLAAATLLALAMTWLGCRRRMRRVQKTVGMFDGVHGTFPAAQGQGSEAWAWEDCTARVVSDFDPETLGADSEDFRQTCLRLVAGDTVEIEARTGSWLYGRIVGEPERGEGFFPQNCCAALSGQDASGLPPLPVGPPAVLDHAGPLVQVACAFSPDEVDEGVLPRELLLAVSVGDVAEVLAAGGGWAYARIVDNPQRVGYVPENRLAWIDGNPAQAGPVVVEVDHE
mmetsp:Transcript_90215/g.232890  ORF Transcript_90215/g.232890 Transcript_90215/m.232890 type:complete len:471 (-) Transcript_90215:542-1954(-)